jgi:hypothetical protein
MNAQTTAGTTPDVHDAHEEIATGVGRTTSILPTSAAATRMSRPCCSSWVSRHSWFTGHWASRMRSSCAGCR